MKLNIEDLGVVGIIVDDWDITRSYRAKTITTDYSTWICYISRKDVPAGIPITDYNYWKPLTRLQAELALDYQNFKELVIQQVRGINALVDTFIQSTTPVGLALDGRLGSHDDRGITQRGITDAINDIWAWIDNYSGQTNRGFVMSVDPPYVIGEGERTITITATCVGGPSKFDTIAFYLNDSEEPLAPGIAEDVSYFNTSVTVSDTCVITCKAVILGIPYQESKIIKYMPAFYMGGGDDYNDVLDVNHLCDLDENMRGNFNILVPTNKHIVIVMEDYLRPNFNRADLNGVEVQFSERNITVNDINYVELVSDETFEGDNYNIDING